jgi:hypothetical protein
MKKLALVLCLLLALVSVSAPPALSVVNPCSGHNSIYCTYAWNKLSACCYPTFIAPGAFCPQICL